jgi:pSer/pThr/pTyr-binding forkhead associated (FHA) protein
MFQLKPDPHAYDDRHHLLLVGQGGLVEGERVKVSLGESVVLGRSRLCDLSLKKSLRYLECDGADRRALRERLSFRAVSRRHCCITYLAPDLVEVVNLSPNGTFVDGHRVDPLVLRDARSRSHEIRLGPHGDVVSLACGSVELSAESA